MNANYWGKGLGREIAQGLVSFAIDERDAEKVVACTRESNYISRAIVEALGFEETHQILGEDGINRIWYVVFPASFKRFSC
jgi:RimJ/RimL family protein N-acetyltransferase